MNNNVYQEEKTKNKINVTMNPLLEYDNTPLVIIANENNNVYMGILFKQFELYDRYLVVKVDKEQLRELFLGTLGLKNIYTSPKENKYYFMDRFYLWVCSIYDEKHPNSELRYLEEIDTFDESWLPDKDCFLLKGVNMGINNG